MIRKAKAVWRGTGRAGSGDLSTNSGVLAQTPYSFKTRFENEKGTNREELIAAAHAGCFTMALVFQLQGGGYTPRNSAPRRPSLWTRTARAFASPARRCRCVPTCRTWTKPRSPEWLGKPRKTARSPRSLTPKYWCELFLDGSSHCQGRCHHHQPHQQDRSRHRRVARNGPCDCARAHRRRRARHCPLRSQRG